MFQFPEVMVKPAPGCKVRLAGGGIVPADGILAPRNFFIERLIASGDLVVVEAPKAAPPDVTAGSAKETAAPAAIAPSPKG
jgi:hypothetical protein